MYNVKLMIVVIGFITVVTGALKVASVLIEKSRINE